MTDTGALTVNQQLIVREMMHGFEEAMNSFVDTVVGRSEAQALNMPQGERAAHVARVRACAEMRRDAALALMSDAMDLEGERV